MRSAEQHARWLLRCYPRVWRVRYGEELTALIVDNLSERPRSLRQDLDVVRAGVAARLSACGIAPGPVRDRSAATMAAAAGAVVFVASALSIWTQLADGWVTTRPDSPAATAGLVTLSLWLAALIIVSLVVGVRVVRSAVRSAQAGNASEVLRPLAVLLLSAGVLVAGVRLMAPQSPAARGGHGAGMLAIAARATWAVTDTISTYWLHPHRLLTLPASELAWMTVSPVAIVALVWAAIRLAQAGRQPVLRRGAHVPTIAGIAALPCFVTAAAWVIGSQHAANATYRAGTLDFVLIASMAAAVFVVHNALSVSRAATD